MINQALKRYLKNYKLSELQENKIIEMSDAILTSKNQIHSQSTLIEEMKNSYNKKSLKSLKYFLFNISQSYNGLTGEFYGKNWSHGLFKYENNFKYIEKKDGELSLGVKEKDGAYLKNQDKLYAYKIYAKAKYLDWHNMQTHRIKKFITLTLPSEFHSHKWRRNAPKTYNESSMIKNKNFKFTHLNMDEAIELGLKKLNEIERYFSKILNRDIGRYIKKAYGMTLKDYEQKNGYKIIDKIKFLESHKAGLTGHLHAMYWLDEELENIFDAVLSNTIEHFKLNAQYCDSQTIDKASGSSYIYKYIIKDLKKVDNDIKNDENYNNLPNYYRRYFSNIRFFSSSRFRHSTQGEIDIIYSFLSKNRPELLQYYKSLEKPLYVSLEELSIKKIFTFEYEKQESTTIDYTELKKLIDKFLKNDILLYKENSRYKNELDTLLSKELFFIPESIFTNKTIKEIHQKILKSNFKNQNESMLGLFSDSMQKDFNSQIWNEQETFESLKKRIEELLLENIDFYIKNVNIKTIEKAFVDSQLIAQNHTFNENKFLRYCTQLKSIKKTLLYIDNYINSDTHNYSLIKLRGSMVEVQVNEKYFLDFMDNFENGEYEKYAYRDITYNELQTSLSPLYL